MLKEEFTEAVMWHPYDLWRESEENYELECLRARTGAVQIFHGVSQKLSGLQGRLVQRNSFVYFKASSKIAQKTQLQSHVHLKKKHKNPFAFLIKRQTRK